MRVFVTGGTGLIGAAIVQNLISHGYQVIGLARSLASQKRLEKMGASAFIGDITTPDIWCDDLPDIDAVIHAACDFSDQMAEIDRNLLDHLIPALHRMPGKTRFIYTGGTWLFPKSASGGFITEDNALDPLPEFSWMRDGIARVMGDDQLHSVVVHPACVYGGDHNSHTGLLARDIETAQVENRVSVIGGDDITLPIIHADDLADLYRLALERAEAGSSYLGVGINGVTNRQVSGLIAKQFGGENCEITKMSVETAMEELGDWALGLAHHQVMSSAKATHELGWQAKHTDIAADIRSLSSAES